MVQLGVATPQQRARRMLVTGLRTLDEKLKFYLMDEEQTVPCILFCQRGGGGGYSEQFSIIPTKYKAAT